MLGRLKDPQAALTARSGTEVGALMIRLLKTLAVVVAFGVAGWTSAAEASAPKIRAELDWLIAAHQAVADRHGRGRVLVQVVSPTIAVSRAEPAGGAIRAVTLSIEAPSRQLNWKDRGCADGDPGLFARCS